MKKLRTWIYIHNPVDYDISCDICDGTKITWSEFERCVWCYSCKKDVPGTGGIFDGPIPYELTKMLGISFDRVDLKTKKRLYHKVKDGKIVWEDFP